MYNYILYIQLYVRYFDTFPKPFLCPGRGAARGRLHRDHAARFGIATHPTSQGETDDRDRDGQGRRKGGKAGKGVGKDGKSQDAAGRWINIYQYLSFILIYINLYIIKIYKYYLYDLIINTM